MGTLHVARHNRKALEAQKGKKSNSSGLTADFSLMEADTVFGRPSEWTAPFTDIETGASAPPNHLPLTNMTCAPHYTLPLMVISGRGRLSIHAEVPHFVVHSLRALLFSTGQSGADVDSDSDSSDSDSDEMPFLALPRPSQDQADGTEAREAASRRSKKVMEIPEAVEAVTGVNASYLPVAAHFHVHLHLHMAVHCLLTVSYNAPCCRRLGHHVLLSCYG